MMYFDAEKSQTARGGPGVTESMNYGDRNEHYCRQGEPASGTEEYCRGTCLGSIAGTHKGLSTSTGSWEVETKMAKPQNAAME